MPDTDPAAEARLAAIQARQAERAADRNDTTDTSSASPDEIWAAHRRREEATLRANAIEACKRCDRDGYDGLTVCTHDTHQAETNRRGIAACRAALTRPADNTPD